MFRFPELVQYWTTGPWDTQTAMRCLQAEVDRRILLDYVYNDDE
jgi:hypothetical protein